MLAIKLKKIGKRGQKSFRLVITEKRTKLMGDCLEDLGWYDPVSKKGDLKGERVAYWVEKGAQPTASVAQLLKRYKILPKKPESQKVERSSKE